MEYKSKKIPPIITANQAQEENPARNKVIIKTKTKDNSFGNNGHDTCMITSKKIRKNKPISLIGKGIK